MPLIKYTFKDHWGHLASELNKAIARKKLNDDTNYRAGLKRALNIIDEMIELHNTKHTLKELLKVRDIIANAYCDGKYYSINLIDIVNYCLHFQKIKKNA